ncbi:MAG: hypothetical protein EU547_04255 [Promethearchaeota archaeon]|nr:MAG: hypothetical protein EU547_04255 [Candidatus Lokiarchaeota archaeon]
MIILTGFEKFSVFSENISETLTQSFPDSIQNIPIVKKVLPVNWVDSIEEYKNSLTSIKSYPNLVILTGVYSGKKILMERYAWNLAIGLDNSNRYKLGLINLNQPIRKKTSLDLEILIYLINKPKKISVSSFPGFYLCNYIYFWALSLAKGNYPVIFIHLPSSINIKKLKRDLVNIIKIIINY